jgi:hypothetical protein
MNDSTLTEETVEESSIAWTSIHILYVIEALQLEAEVKQINSDLILSCVILKNSSEETLREEESW